MNVSLQCVNAHMVEILNGELTDAGCPNIFCLKICNMGEHSQDNSINTEKLLTKKKTEGNPGENTIYSITS